MSAMLCAALYPNVVQVHFHSPSRWSGKLKAKNKCVVPVLCTWLDIYHLCTIQVRAPQGSYKMTSKGAMKMQPKANELRFMTKNDGCVHVHPSSVNYTVR